MEAGQIIAIANILQLFANGIRNCGASSGGGGGGTWQKVEKIGKGVTLS